MAWIPGMLAITLFLEKKFKSDIFSFCLSKGVYLFLLLFTKFVFFEQGWDKTCTNIKEHFDNILIVHLGRVICASLACCATFADVPPTPSFISNMNLRTFPSNFENFLQGLVHKRYASNVCDSISPTFINQTRHHV